MKSPSTSRSWLSTLLGYLSFFKKRWQHQLPTPTIRPPTSKLCYNHVYTYSLGDLVGVGLQGQDNRSISYMYICCRLQ